MALCIAAYACFVQCGKCTRMGSILMNPLMGSGAIKMTYRNVFFCIIGFQAYQKKSMFIIIYFFHESIYITLLCFLKMAVIVDLLNIIYINVNYIICDIIINSLYVCY